MFFPVYGAENEECPHFQVSKWQSLARNDDRIPGHPQLGAKLSYTLFANHLIGMSLLGQVSF